MTAGGQRVQQLEDALATSGARAQQAQEEAQQAQEALQQAQRALQQASAQVRFELLNVCGQSYPVHGLITSNLLTV